MAITTPLSAAEAERLHLLAEEAAEVIQAVTKILRHGYDSTGYSNREDLEREIGDLQAAIVLVKTFDVRADEIERHEIAKGQRLATVLHHQGDGLPFASTDLQ